MSDFDDNRFELVSSLYGPGTTGCWYLTVLSCYISLAAHPTKGTSGSIDADLIVVLTFPAVAAGHVLVQTRSFPPFDGDAVAQSQITKLVSALEASLNVTENFVALSVILLLVAIIRKCVKRTVNNSTLLFLGGIRMIYQNTPPEATAGSFESTFPHQLYVAAHRHLRTSPRGNIIRSWCCLNVLCQTDIASIRRRTTTDQVDVNSGSTKRKWKESSSSDKIDIKSDI